MRGLPGAWHRKAGLLEADTGCFSEQNGWGRAEADMVLWGQLQLRLVWTLPSSAGGAQIGGFP